MSSSKKLLQSASGFINQSSSALNVEDVFSTYVYRGTGSDGNQIVNGIDLANEGGMVWIKNRVGGNGGLMDTARGVGKILHGTYNNNAEDTEASNKGLASFNSDGFLLNQEFYGSTNSATDFVSYTFRKAPNFFDVVTYNGSSSAQTIAHNLGSVPGMIIIKQRNSSYDWKVYHRSVGNTKELELNTSAEAYVNSSWNNTTPTATHFTLANVGGVNASGNQYVAYLFAHDTSDEGLIQCGEFTTDSSGDYDGLDDLGWEPQWIMVKGYEHSGILTGWFISDHVRGLNSVTNDVAFLADQSGAEFSQENFEIGPKGFKIFNFPNSSASGKFIYMAIRRGPMATPTTRSKVFGLDSSAYTGSNSWIPAFGTTNFADFVIAKNRGTTEDIFTNSRLMGVKYLVTNNNSTHADGTGVIAWDYMTGAWVNALNNSRYSYVWSRAPGFFDVVTYVGNNTAGQVISHNLGVQPEMIWTKLRSTGANDWSCWHKALGNKQWLRLNTDAAYGSQNSGAGWNPTTTTFNADYYSGGANYSSEQVAYLFATLDGISKVGSFSHTNGSSTNVDCGFSSGSYFVLVKRTDASGDWYVWDAGTGIGAGTDIYFVLNSNAANNNSSNYIAQLNSGFTMESDFPTGSYIFYAIAN